jgi:demethylmenaquinone methyltransferase/2-methoxy-6-polyprenyl-1,4-benzoquinol methylase
MEPSDVLPDDGVVREQIDYYDRRANEYDATSAPEDDILARQDLRLERALRDFRPEGRVLEVACGTGAWTRRLVQHADDMTALDSSAEMIRLARTKIGDAEVRFITTDVFSWRPDQTYDVVFFANWLSHVPETRFQSFWSLVDDCLNDSGRVFFVDESRDAWRKEEHLEDNLVLRRLEDGSAHRVIKIFWEPSELQDRLRTMKWNAIVESTGDFIWGECKRLVD